MIKRLLKHRWGMALMASLCIGSLGTCTPAQAASASDTANPWLSTFGRGSVEVRIYSDFFCGPCRAEEPEVATLLTRIVDQQAAQVTFVDYPGHSESSLYAVYFLAALNAKGGGDIHQATSLRAAFYEAAASNISGRSALEEFLGQKGIPFRPLDYRPTFKTFEKWIVADKVLETPTCTIIGPQGKQTLSGKSRIIKALQEIAQGR